MKVKYHESQDICLTLDNREFEKLISKRTADFFDNVIKAPSLEAEAYFYLGCCIDLFKSTGMDVEELDGGVQLILPKEIGDPYYINLFSDSVDKLKEIKQYSSRYPGGSKLMIIIKEGQKNDNKLDRKI